MEANTRAILPTFTPLISITLTNSMALEKDVTQRNLAEHTFQEAVPHERWKQLSRLRAGFFRPVGFAPVVMVGAEVLLCLEDEIGKQSKEKCDSL